MSLNATISNSISTGIHHIDFVTKLFYLQNIELNVARRVKGCQPN